MRHYNDFLRTGISFKDRVGEPDSFSAAIGRLVIWFSVLETQLSQAIHDLLNVDASKGEMITSEMSFKNKVNLMSSLVKNCSGSRLFNVGPIPLNELLSEIVARCFKAEELRNKILHSSWIPPIFNDESVVRRKPTSKAKRGMYVNTEEMDSGYLLDIADFISCVGSDIEEFFLRP